MFTTQPKEQYNTAQRTVQHSPKNSTTAQRTVQHSPKNSTTQPKEQYNTAQRTVQHSPKNTTTQPIEQYNTAQRTEVHCKSKYDRIPFLSIGVYHGSVLTNGEKSLACCIYCELLTRLSSRWHPHKSGSFVCVCQVLDICVCVRQVLDICVCVPGT